MANDKVTNDERRTLVPPTLFRPEEAPSKPVVFRKAAATETKRSPLTNFMVTRKATTDRIIQNGMKASTIPDTQEEERPLHRGEAAVLQEKLETKRFRARLVNKRPIEDATEVFVPGEDVRLPGPARTPRQQVILEKTKSGVEIAPDFVSPKREPIHREDPKREPGGCS